MHVIRTDCKYVLWFKIDRIIFDTVEDVVVEVCYIPPEGNRMHCKKVFNFALRHDVVLLQDNRLLALAF